jgi:EAL domain-containing protein (putative c-di-GMP-specific phosphodiesterase class I)
LEFARTWPADAGAVSSAIEVAGLSADLDEAIIRTALMDQRAWLEATGCRTRVSVNISALLLLDPTLGERLKPLELAPGQICFELLETAFLEAEESVLHENLARIRSYGIEIEIDDFGSGHASILSLLAVAPTRIKIDRRLIAPISHSATQRKIVRAIAEIGALCGAETVAEGIETEDHAVIASAMGCSVLQGYGLGRPMDGSRVPALLLEHATARRRAVGRSA